jgi:hypothetical protein
MLVPRACQTPGVRGWGTSGFRSGGSNPDSRRASQDAGGISNLMVMLRDSGKPVIGHNCLFDLVYILTQFVAPHATWPDFKAAIAQWLPAGVYDTKYLSKMLLGRHKAILPSTTLGPLYEHLKQHGEDAPHIRLLADAAASGVVPRCGILLWPCFSCCYTTCHELRG